MQNRDYLVSGLQGVKAKLFCLMQTHDVAGHTGTRKNRLIDLVLTLPLGLKPGLSKLACLLPPFRPSFKPLFISLEENCPVYYTGLCV